MKSTRIKRFLRSTAIVTAIVIASFTVVSSAWTPNTAPHSGISYSQYPDGYQSSNNPVVTFNSYTDFPASLTNIKSPWDQSLGNTVYQGPLDERHFLRVVKRDPNTHTRSTYTYNDIDFTEMSQGKQSQESGIEDGDTLVFWVYIHNNASPGANDANNKSGAAIAKDVSLRVDLDGTGESINPTAYLSASNATPKQISSDTLISGDDKFSLEPIGRNGGIYTEDGFRQFTLAEMQSLFSNNGLDIGSERGRTDEWLGCSQHQRWVTFEVQVKEAPKVCEKLVIEPRVLADGKVCATITEGDYEGKLTWTSTGGGKMVSNGGTVVDSTIQTEINTSESRESCTIIQGITKDQEATLKVVADDAANTCFDEIKTEPEAPVCKSLKFTKRFVTDGNICANLQGKYDGIIRFTIDGPGNIRNYGQTAGTGEPVNYIDTRGVDGADSCVRAGGTGPGTEITIEAIESNVAECKDSIKAAEQPGICQSLEFTKRPSTTEIQSGLYCVKANPNDSYDGTMQWTLTGQGGLSEPQEDAPLSLDPRLTDLSVDDGTVSIREDLLIPSAPTLENLPSIANKALTTELKNGQWCAFINAPGEDTTLDVKPTETEAAKLCNVKMQNTPTPPGICKSLEFTQRPDNSKVADGRYCVKANPNDSYEGKMTWTVTGGGQLADPAPVPISSSQPDGTVSLREDLLLPGPPTLQIPEGTIITEFSNGQWCADLTGTTDETKLDIRTTDFETSKQCNLTINNTPEPPSGGQCEEIELTPSGDLADGEYCVSVTKGEYSGEIEWTTVNADAIKDLRKANRQVTTIDSKGTNRSCITINDYEHESNSKLTVRAIGENAGTCQAIRTRSEDEPPVVKKKPEIEKGVKRVKDGKSAPWKKRVTVPYNGAKDDRTHGQVAELVQYRIDYTFETTEPVDVNIVDIDLNRPENPDYIGRDGRVGGTKGGSIDYANHLEILHGDALSANRTRVEPCNANGINPEEDICFEGDIDENSGVLVRNATMDITIFYTGRMNSIIDDTSCKDLRQSQDCAERFFNKARGVIIVEIPNPDGEGTRTLALKETDIISNDTQVMVPCRFFLTRAGGDVFFEDELGVGVDAQFCGRRSTTGIIIKRREETEGRIPSTGLEDIQTFSHEVCQLSSVAKDSELYNKYKKDIEALPEGYIDPISDFSSLICEIQLATASDLNKDFIKASLSENIERIARWNENLANKATISEADFNSGSSLLGEQVLRRKDDLKITSLDLSKIGQASKQFGAKTIIVEGDLTIEGDIKYPALSEEDFLNPREIPSLAFIVLGGDIKVSPDVTELSGVFFVQQEFPGDTKSGRLTSTFDGSGQPKNSEQQLTIFGQVFGDIKELFQTRLYSGDPRRDEGAIVIRYDERIILNTPPGLEQIIDLNQVEVAR